MKKLCAELISFFENKEGYDSNEILEEYIEEILAVTEYSTSEIMLSNGYTEFMELNDFARQLFDKIITGVCNVIRTA